MRKKRNVGKILVGGIQNENKSDKYIKSMEDFDVQELDKGNN